MHNKPLAFASALSLIVVIALAVAMPAGARPGETIKSMSDTIVDTFHDLNQYEQADICLAYYEMPGYTKASLMAVFVRPGSGVFADVPRARVRTAIARAMRIVC